MRAGSRRTTWGSACPAVYSSCPWRPSTAGDVELRGWGAAARSTGSTHQRDQGAAAQALQPADVVGQESAADQQAALDANQGGLLRPERWHAAALGRDGGGGNVAATRPEPPLAGTTTNPSRPCLGCVLPFPRRKTTRPEWVHKRGCPPGAWTQIHAGPPTRATSPLRGWAYSHPEDDAQAAHKQAIHGHLGCRLALWPLIYVRA